MAQDDYPDTASVSDPEYQDEYPDTEQPTDHSDSEIPVEECNDCGTEKKVSRLKSVNNELYCSDCR